MQIILDTHIFLWYVNGDDKLSPRYKEFISDTSNEVYLSVASIWECVIKEQIGKLVFPSSASAYLVSKRIEHNILSMPIDEGSLGYLHSIPHLHKDPFDRIIICQTLRNGCKLITDDQIIRKYPYPIFL